MRIVQVCRTSWPRVGGMETVVDGLSRALADRGHTVRVVTLRWGGGRGPTHHDGVAYERLRRIGPRRYPLAVGLETALRGAEVVHVHGLDGLADQVVARRGRIPAPVGISTHGGYLHTDRSRLLKALWLRTVSARTLRGADAVWFTSRSDQDRIGVAGVSGSVIGNGADLSALLGQPHIPEPGRWVVIGRVDVHKGLHDLLETLAVLEARDPRPFTVDVLGPERVAGLTDGLRRHAARLGLSNRVRFHGGVDASTLRFALSRAELALFPSRYEGFGIAVVEAMAAGVPVLVNRIPAFEELVVQGRFGWLADFSDPIAAAGALARVRGTDHGPMLRATREHAASYDWSRRVLAWEEAYTGLLEGRGA